VPVFTVILISCQLFVWLSSLHSGLNHEWRPPMYIDNIAIVLTVTKYLLIVVDVIAYIKNDLR